MIHYFSSFGVFVYLDSIYVMNYHIYHINTNIKNAHENEIIK